jgi:hypothetical protein
MEEDVNDEAGYDDSSVEGVEVGGEISSGEL